MANQNIQAKLREGVEAARRGDKITARRLLQQVLLSDKNNEIALMWMASVSDALDDRRAFLERVVQINPTNERAREALRRLGVEIKTVSAPMNSSGQRETARSTFTRGEVPSSGRAPNLYLIAAAVVAVVVIAVIVLTVVNNLNSQPTPATLAVAQATSNALFEPSATSTQNTSPPTATVFTGIIVTLDPNSVSPLPPSWTPLPTLPPPASLTPIPTNVPASAYSMVTSDFDPRLGRASLYVGTADNLRRVGINEQAYEQVDYDPNSERIVFVSPVYYPAEGDTPEVFAQEIFSAPLNNPNDITQVTHLRVPHINLPQWSPDGSRILFSMAQDGDEELYLITPDGGGMIQLTRNNAIDTEGRFRPDGMIAFTSDEGSPGFTEIWTVAPDGALLARLTNHPGSSYSPDYSPDGSRIAYINDQSGDGDVYIMDANGQRPFLLTTDDNGAEDRDPVWSPDGQWIAFTSNRSGEAFGWYAVDLFGTVTPIYMPEDRIPQSLNFVALEGDQ